jgi:hypothetical protein
MEIKRLLNISEQQELDVELQFNESGLKIFKINVDADTNDEVLEIIHVQPYKPNDDGSKSAWAGAEDAFNWFEDNRREMF